MVLFTEIKRNKPITKMIGDMINKTKPKDFISEKNSNLSKVMPVPKNTTKVLKYAKNVRSFASFVRSIANQSLVINGDLFSIIGISP